MRVLLLLVFVSVILVLLAIVLFGMAHKNRDFDHIDELSLMPLEEDEDVTAKHHV